MMPTSVLFSGHRERKQRRQEQERAQVAILERAALEAEEYAKAETLEFLESWLINSVWSDQVELISITRENLPPIDELWSFGELAETQGTHACRRLFKAPVIWDELGHSLWQMLKNEASDRSSRSQIQEDAYTADYASPPRSRCSSRSSAETYYSEPESRRPSITKVTSIHKGFSGKNPIRRATDPQFQTTATIPVESVKSCGSRSRLHKIIPHGCYANVVRKTMGAVHQGDCN
ncbi:hypothetical protein B0T10DRAFT_144498 [Thelonectria olida]|uniref:Uncharacterized protein n=1 Tax=Thelonectria olida TaxID=1576542 RepID=A0A9P9AN79_9HYPO|nr:hypothetical protein B0T10DRAFT_144498 [Thelonectria olida]